MKYEFPVVLTKCYICGESSDILMSTRGLTGERIKEFESMHNKVVTKEPCSKCKEYMKQGIILISVKDGESGDNPYRTGGWVVIKQEAAEKLFIDINFNEDRICFIEDKVWDIVGLPRERIDEK